MKLFLPGGLCLLDEDSDLAGGYRRGAIAEFTLASNIIPPNMK
ncbi:MAG: hypothetical protein SXA11_20115 [Cyanobacteriota bacterium]|nr:hypothetical protein [Cyanobacteriota bacterium]